MDSDEIDIEEFYRNWLKTNTPQKQSKSNESVENEEQPTSIENIVFENNMFQLFVEKGKNFKIFLFL
jgi:hypothetical protein